MDKIEELKRTYDKALIRRYQGEEYLTNKYLSDTKEHQEKAIEGFNKYTVMLGELMKKYKLITGISMTKNEILYGFKIN